MSKTIAFTVADELYEYIGQTAKKMHKTKAGIVREYLEEALYNQYAYQKTEEMSRELKEGKTTTVP